MKFLMSLLALLALSACSSATYSQPPPRDPEIQEIAEAACAHIWGPVSRRECEDEKAEQLEGIQAIGDLLGL